MIWTRRRAMGWGGGIVAALSMAGRTGLGGDWVEIQMSGRDGGAEVWFDPIGILIEPGRTVRWINRDGGNAHTATAYHPDLFDRPLRIPEHASPWDSDYLLPGDAFSLTLTEPGVYDYYCVPHEMAGMVGRIIVGEPGPGDRRAASGAAQGIPDAALAAFPEVEAIMAMGIVRRA